MKTANKKEHYSFFGLTAKVDFTDCYRKAKADGESFFLYSLHGILKALNSIPEVAVGKLHEGNGRMVMSVSIKVNHGLVAGRHIGLLVDTLPSVFQFIRPDG